MYLIKKIDGSFIPAYPADHQEAAKIKPGEEVRATRTRNPDLHRKLFAMLRLGFENQDKFTNIDIYRQVLTMKAGFVHWVKGTDGREYPFPASWSFDSMDQTSFEKLYEAILEVICRETGSDKKLIMNELLNFM